MSGPTPENGGIINRDKKCKRKEPNLRKKNDRLSYTAFDMTQHTF